MHVRCSGVVICGLSGLRSFHYLCFPTFKGASDPEESEVYQRSAIECLSQSHVSISMHHPSTQHSTSPSKLYHGALQGFISTNSCVKTLQELKSWCNCTLCLLTAAARTSTRGCACLRLSQRSAGGSYPSQATSLPYLPVFNAFF